MNRNKGFTLIELLAVVMLLGIVAVVSVPVVKNITKDAKQKGLEKQISTVLESAKNWAIKNTDLLPEVSGSILVKMETLKKQGYLENKIITNPVDKSEMNGCAKISYNGDFNQYEYDYDETCESNKQLLKLATTSTDLGVSSVDSCAEDVTECDLGTAFAIQVNKDKTYKFYVLNDDGNKVTLIMDRNIGSQVAWVSKTDYITAGGSETDYGSDGNNNKGPITVLNYLNSQINSETETWTNIDPIESYEYVNNLNGTTNTVGYQKLTITNGVGVLTSQDGTTTNLTGTMRARILTFEEAFTFEINYNEIMPTWLYENLSDSNTSARPYGYWFLTAYPRISNVVRHMPYNGHVHELNGWFLERYDGYNGARPVIELSKGPIY